MKPWLKALMIFVRAAVIVLSLALFALAMTSIKSSYECVEGSAENLFTSCRTR